MACKRVLSKKLKTAMHVESDVMLKKIEIEKLERRQPRRLNFDMNVAFNIHTDLFIVSIHMPIQLIQANT